MLQRHAHFLYQHFLIYRKLSITTFSFPDFITFLRHHIAQIENQ